MSYLYRGMGKFSVN